MKEALDFVAKLADLMKSKGITKLDVVYEEQKYSLEMPLQPAPFVASAPEPIEPHARGDDGLTDDERSLAYAST